MSDIDVKVSQGDEVLKEKLMSQIEILSLETERGEGKYPPFPEVYPYLMVTLKFKRIESFENGVLTSSS